MNKEVQPVNVVTRLVPTPVADTADARAGFFEIAWDEFSNLQIRDSDSCEHPASWTYVKCYWNDRVTQWISEGFRRVQRQLVLHDVASRIRDLNGERLRLVCLFSSSVIPVAVMCSRRSECGMGIDGCYYFVNLV